MQPAFEMVPLSKFDLSLSEMRVMSMERVIGIEKSMRLHGQLQPVVARLHEGRYQIIDGFKRYYASEDLMLDALQCRVLEVDLTQAKVLLLTYNRSHQSMEAWEEALVLEDLMLRHDIDQAGLAKLTGYSRSWVSRRLSLISKMDREVSTDIRMGVLTGSHARALIKLPRGNQQEVARAISRFNLTSRQSNTLAGAFLKAGDKNLQQYILEHPEQVLCRLSNEEDTREPYDARLSGYGNGLMLCISDVMSGAEAICLKLKELHKCPLKETERVIIIPQMQRLLKLCHELTVSVIRLKMHKMSQAGEK